MPASPIPESEFATMTLDGFKAMTPERQKATLARMDQPQFARWLARAVPPKDERATGFTDEVYARRRQHG
jgi:hypothetical protein